MLDGFKIDFTADFVHGTSFLCATISNYMKRSLLDVSANTVGMSSMFNLFIS